MDEDFESVLRQSEGTHARHPASQGWRKDLERTTGSVPSPTPAMRLVEAQWHAQGTIAIVTEGPALVAAFVRILRQNTEYVRHAIVHPWGLALPCGSGSIHVDVQLLPEPPPPSGPGSPPPFRVSPLLGGDTLIKQWVSASLTYGVPTSEQVPVDDLELPIAGPLQPVNFARTVTLTVLSGALTAPVPLAAGQSVTLSARPRNLDGQPGTRVAVHWGVLSP